MPIFQRKTRTLFCGFVIFMAWLCLFLFSNVKIVNAETRAWTEGKAECVMEVNSRRVLYASHADAQLPMASTTKILTAITVLNHCKNLQEELSIPKEAEGIEGSSVYLKAGDKYTVEQLLYGLMLRSGNDCAAALALHVGKSMGGFSLLMNKTAEKAGALQSHFKNPHGLPCDGHYTTATDLSLITCYAMENPIFQAIVSTRYYAPCQWANKNKMLKLYDGACGVKTGYTKQAGRCLVSSAKKNGMTLVCSLLNCPTTYERTMQLFDDAFAVYAYKELVVKGQEFVLEVGKQQMRCAACCSYAYPLLKEEEQFIRIETKAIEPYANEKNERIVGQFQIYLAKQLLFLGNLYKL